MEVILAPLYVLATNSEASDLRWPATRKICLEDLRTLKSELMQALPAICDILVAIQPASWCSPASTPSGMSAEESQIREFTRQLFRSMQPRPAWLIRQRFFRMPVEHQWVEDHDIGPFIRMGLQRHVMTRLLKSVDIAISEVTALEKNELFSGTDLWWVEMQYQEACLEVISFLRSNLLSILNWPELPKATMLSIAADTRCLYVASQSSSTSGSLEASTTML